MINPSSAYRVTYTEAMVRDAVRSFVWQRFVREQKGLWLAAAGLLVLLAILLWRGDRSWVVGVLAVVVLLPVLLLVAGWAAHSRNTVGRFRRMPTPSAEVAFREEGLSFASELGSAQLPWSVITDIWERPGYWMIFTAPNQFSTLPTATIAAVDLEALRSRVRRISMRG